MIDIPAMVSIIKETATTIVTQMKVQERQVAIESDKAWAAGFTAAVDNAANLFYGDYSPRAYVRHWSLYADPLAEVNFGSGGLLESVRLVEENMRGAPTTKGKYGQFRRTVEEGRHGFAKTPPLSPPPIDHIERDVSRISEYMLEYEEKQLNSIFEEGVNLLLSSAGQISSMICSS